VITTWDLLVSDLIKEVAWSHGLAIQLIKLEVADPTGKT
jgi:hypothetical protein